MIHVLTFEDAKFLVQHEDGQVQIIYNDDQNSEPLPAWQTIDEYCNDLLSVADALAIAQKDIESFIKIVRSAKTSSEAEAEVAKFFALSPKQAHGIVNLSLSEITGGLDCDQFKAKIEAKRAWYKKCCL